MRFVRDVVLDHHFDKLVETYFWLPAQLLFGLRRVADQ